MYIKDLNNGFSASSTTKGVKAVTKLINQLMKLTPDQQAQALAQIQATNPTLYAQLVGLTGSGSSTSAPASLINPMTGQPVTPYFSNGRWTAVTADASTGQSVIAYYSPGYGWVNQATGQLVTQTTSYGTPTYSAPGYQAPQVVYNPQTGQYVNAATGVPVNVSPVGSNYYPSSSQYYYGGQPVTPFYQSTQYAQPYNYSPQYTPYPVMPQWTPPYPSDPSATANDFPIQDSSGVPQSALYAIQAGLQSDAMGLENSAFNIDPFNSFPTLAPYGAAAPVPSDSYVPWLSGGMAIAAVIGFGMYLMMKRSPHRTRVTSRRRRVRR